MLTCVTKDGTLLQLNDETSRCTLSKNSGKLRAFLWKLVRIHICYLLLFSYSVIYEVLDNKAHLYWNNMDYGENHGWEFGGNFDFIICINENHFRSILIKQCDPILKEKYIRCMKRQYVLDVYCCVDVHFSNHSFDWLSNFHCTFLFTILFSKLISHFANMNIEVFQIRNKHI